MKSYFIHALHDEMNAIHFIIISRLHEMNGISFHEATAPGIIFRKTVISHSKAQKSGHGSFCEK
jgi:hypothetical protein